ncbi:recombinase family protein [Nocardia transvalensis]|uniref:recombinase family protein n=1 Tax=Nocardia transvalensis TaxID=37333 RepID=UPI001892F0F5|nr:recombinase family protein [Nocardia transvalensis]MBF6330886.1 recombinase family protein [Nocardia transvalensis]
MDKIYGIYCRISEADPGDTAGVDRQEKECRALVVELGGKVYKVYVDNDISAFSGKHRPQYEAMKADLEAGRINGVVAWHPDRLYRRNTDLEPLIDLCERTKADVKTVTAGDLDLATASGRMVARMLGAASTHEVERTIERMQAAKKQAAHLGKPLGGKRPFGFQSDHIAHELAEADAIADGTQKIINGTGNLYTITQEWHTAGLRGPTGKPLTPAVVKGILIRWRNAGLSTYKGEIVAEAVWQPIVSAEDVKAVRAVLAQNQRLNNEPWKRKRIGTSVYLCHHCDGPTVVGSRKWKHTRKRELGTVESYMCVERCFHRAAKPIDDKVEGAVLDALAKGRLPARKADDSVDIREIIAKKTVAQRKLDELTEMFAEGLIDSSQLRSGTAVIRAQLAGYDEQLGLARELEYLDGLTLNADDIASTWEGLTPEAKGAVIDMMCEVRISKPRPRGRIFDSETVEIIWK